MEARRPRWVVVAVVAGLVLGSAGCVWLTEFRVDRTGRFDLAFMPENLALAWLPLLFAAALYWSHRKGAPWPVIALLAVPWLLFLPNAPYILTDFVHLGRARGAPLWFDALLIGAFAGTGLLLGYASLYVVQEVVSERLGDRIGWCVTLGSLALSSVGIYIGRFLRFNSWDVIARPEALAHFARSRLTDPLGNPKLLVVAALLTLALWTGYAFVYGAARLGGLHRGEPGRR
jgi:uncharacterized membrane protein